MISEIVDIVAALSPPLKVAWTLWLAWGVVHLVWWRRRPAAGTVPVSAMTTAPADAGGPEPSSALSHQAPEPSPERDHDAPAAAQVVDVYRRPLLEHRPPPRALLPAAAERDFGA